MLSRRRFLKASVASMGAMVGAMFPPGVREVAAQGAADDVEGEGQPEGVEVAAQEGDPAGCMGKGNPGRFPFSLPERQVHIYYFPVVGGGQ